MDELTVSDLMMFLLIPLGFWKFVELAAHVVSYLQTHLRWEP